MAAAGEGKRSKNDVYERPQPILRPKGLVSERDLLEGTKVMSAARAYTCSRI